MLDALPCDVGEWSITEALSKSLEEMPAAQSCHASKVNDPNSRADVGRNVRRNALLLPRCETASHRDFGMDRESLDGAVQKLRGALKAGFRSSAIAVQRSSCDGDERRQRAAAETVSGCVRHGGRGVQCARCAPSGIWLRLTPAVAMVCANIIPESVLRVLHRANVRVYHALYGVRSRQDLTVLQYGLS